MPVSHHGIRSRTVTFEQPRLPGKVWYTEQCIAKHCSLVTQNLVWEVNILFYIPSYTTYMPGVHNI